jgi:hypothetical protein
MFSILNYPELIERALQNAADAPAAPRKKRA